MYEVLVNRLRGKARLLREYNDPGALEDEAADVIEKLSAFVAQISDGRFYVARDGVLYELNDDPRTIRISSPLFLAPEEDEVEKDIL